MIKLYYISPSILPSRSANSIHVVSQCLAFIELGYKVSIFAKRSIKNKKIFKDEMSSQYGANHESLKFVTFFSRFNKGDTLKIAIIALFHLHKNKFDGAILSRNLYAAFWLGVIESKAIIFETHMLEISYKKWLQKKIIESQNVKTIVISNKLKEILAKYHNISTSKLIVLHDAAREAPLNTNYSFFRNKLRKMLPESASQYKNICGYFGHLYPGRGIEIIESMAFARKEVLFVIIGGNEFDILSHKKKNNLKNIFFLGYLEYLEAQEIMRAVDVLLMPYQKSVSIGLTGHDTAQYMSPMKMFEYMSTGIPIISSNLPVLSEVLINKFNALLVEYDSKKDWVNALDRILEDDNLAQKISKNAYDLYLNDYTWSARSRKIMELTSS